MKTKSIVICALMAAVMCICSVISVPIGEVSITLGVLGVLLSAVILGWRKGVIATLVFILLGAIGLPVFSNMQGGVGVLAGPTGGYIYSYIIMSLITGLVADRFAKSENRGLKLGAIFASCIVGVAVCYAMGTVQFMLVMDWGLKETLAVCVIPFIPFDLAKSVVATGLGLKLRKFA